MDDLVITLPGLPPTVNTAYLHRAHGGKQRTPAAMAWQAGAILAIRAAAAPASAVARRAPWAAAIHLTAPDVYRWDADNRVKLALDAVAAALRLDDRYCTQITVTKSRAPTRQTMIRVSEGPPC